MVRATCDAARRPVPVRSAEPPGPSAPPSSRGRPRGASPRALALVAAGLIGCGPAGADLPPLGGVRLLLTTAADDYSAGGLAAFDPAWDAPVDLATLHGDAVVAADGGTAWAINRLGMDTVRRYDALGALPTWEVGTGRGSNPHAVARVDDRLVVTLYERAEALVLDATTGAPLGSVDLAGHADADGLPEASSAVADGEDVLIAAQRLDRDAGWTASPEGRVLVLDPAGVRPIRAIPVGPNPRLVADPRGGAVVITEDGLGWVDATGALQGPRRRDGLEGVVGALAIADDGGLVAITRACASCAAHTVVCLDGWDGAVTGRSAPIDAFLSNVAIDGSTAWIAARRGWAEPERIAGGLARLDRTTCTLDPPDAWRRGTFAPFDLARWPG